ncbi:flagellar biosynthesis protein FlhB [Bacillus pinisoli]|uniref:flagellar biosynthesis protein FlhB n=1 Tax=Bacillus pinisoli TaxID=2901866 RepID=UPI001FF478BD|nr:flagellar biosynthesis protein FlhB [Bacillus pinisoli]
MYRFTLDLQFFAGEKTEKATPKKRQESRKKGQVAKSQDVNAAILLLFVFLFFWFSGGMMLERMLNLFRKTFEDFMLLELSEETTFSLLFTLLPEIAFIILPVMLVALIGGVMATYMQIGFLFAPEAIKFKLEKLDPIKGAKNIFSMRALVELLKSSLKITFVGLVTFTVLWFDWDGIMRLSQVSIEEALVFLSMLVLKMGFAATIMLLFLSVFDYIYQKFDFEKNIRMSKQDIKDEYKNVEGDPQIKSKIKQKQREMAMQRMMQEVPKADVIITNPTHYAIALKYDETKMDAPYVVASGVDYIALKIRSIAENHEIPTIENRPLARALYEQTEIGDAVPEEFFKAVAEILAYIYRLKQKV